MKCLTMVLIDEFLMQKTSAVLALLLLLLVFTFGPVSAVGPTPSKSMRPSVTPGSQSAAGKMRACQVREGVIKNRLENMTNRAMNMADTFMEIAGRTEEFYTTTSVPAGKTVANYGALVAAIATNKTAIITALDKMKTNQAAFTCTGNVSTQMSGFRADMKTVIDALKKYRTAVKNLIVAVRSVNGDTQE